jgi:hypothetical protein
MGVLLGQYMAVLLIQLIPSVCVYFFLRKRMAPMATAAIIFALALGVGTYAGQRMLLNFFLHEQMAAEEERRGTKIPSGEYQILWATLLHYPGLTEAT